MSTRTLPRTAALIAALAACSPAVHASGFWDAGLFDGAWRSDYETSAHGTAARPLDLAATCEFPQTPFAFCATNFVPIPGLPGPQPARSYSASNWGRQAGARNDFFWLVSANSEPAFDSACNSGPPNQSERVVAPFEGIYGLKVRAATETGRPYRNELVMAVDLSHRPRQLETRPGCVTRDCIPYLGFGTFSDRGGGNVPLALLASGASAPVLSFDFRLVDSNADFFAAGEAVPPRPRGQYAGMLVEAKWAGRKRWVWIDLLKAHDNATTTFMSPWNWGVRDSFYFPGAEIVFTSGKALRAECGATGFDLPDTAPATFAHRRPVPMRIDLTRLFECVGNRFTAPFAAQPAPVALTGLQYFVEIGIRERDGLPGLSATDYDSRMGVAIDGIDIVSRSGTPMSSDAEFVAQMARDLAGREWSAAERAHWLSRIASSDRTKVVAEMLAAADVRGTTLAAARLNLVAFGFAPNRPAFDASLARLRAGDGVPAAAATLAQGAAFQQATGALGSDAFVRLMFARVLGMQLDAHPDSAAIAAAFGSISDWVARLDSGRATRADVLLAAFRLANARDLLVREANIAVLYHAFFGVLPDAGGIGGWRGMPDMPERLIEALYYSGPYRQRFGG